MKITVHVPPPAEKEIVITLTLMEAKALLTVARHYSISWPELQKGLIDKINEASK